MSELQLPAHPRLHLRFWRLQRLAWLGFAAILEAAVLGLTGAGGPPAQTFTRTKGGRVDHPRVGRWSTGDEIRVVFTPLPSGTRTLGMSRAFADHHQVEDIKPQPARSVAGPGRADSCSTRSRRRRGIDPARARPEPETGPIPSGARRLGRVRRRPYPGVGGADGIRDPRRGHLRRPSGHTAPFGAPNPGADDAFRWS